MTQQEHRLMIAMLAQQLQVSMMIFEILKARGVLEDDYDLAAFASFPQPSVALMRLVGESYQQVARIAGVDVRLDDPPAS